MDAEKICFVQFLQFFRTTFDCAAPPPHQSIQDSGDYKMISFHAFTIYRYAIDKLDYFIFIKFLGFDTLIN